MSKESQAQIAYPNLLGFGGQKSMLVDPELRLASIQIFNDAMAEMQGASNKRIFPMALMPWWDIKATVSEAERVPRDGPSRRQYELRPRFARPAQPW